MRKPSPAHVWVVVSQHPRSASILPFTASATRNGAWKKYLEANCGTEPREPHLLSIFASVTARRRSGGLSVQRAVIEVSR
jgi:hypothetical protein